MKTWIIFVLIWCGMGGVAAAKSSVDIYKEHGDNLFNASFHIRFQFEKQTGIYWKKSRFMQRQVFLEDYYEALYKAEKEKRIKEKQALQEERRIQKEKLQKEKESKDKDKAYDRKVRDAKRLKLAEDKAYRDEVKNRIKKINDLRKEQQRKSH